MLLDANLLLYALNKHAKAHQASVAWLTEQLNGQRPVGIPWQSLAAVLRISTHPRAFARPLDAETAWARTIDWVEAPATWVPEPGPRYAEIFGRLLIDHDVRGGLVPDAQLAALALEHGLTVCSVDGDFARFSDVRWQNPLA